MKSFEWQNNQFMDNENYNLFYYRNDYFDSVNLHSHDFFEIYLYINGDTDYIVENGYYNLQPNDIIVIPPLTLHQPKINEKYAQYERIVLWISPKYLNKLSSNQTDLAQSFNHISDMRSYLIRDNDFNISIKELLFKMLESIEMKRYGNDIECEILLKTILLKFCQQYHNQMNSDINENLIGMPTNYSKPVMSIMKIINENVTENLRLDDIANSVFMSKFHLLSIFKKETNSTIYQYILNKKLLLSKKLIEQNIPINQVYLKSGFNDYTNFFRVFKKKFGITPREYYLKIGCD